MSNLTGYIVITTTNVLHLFTMEVNSNNEGVERKLLENLTLQDATTSTTLLESELENVESSVIRHCASCLQVSEPPAKTCGGCKKRAYCSKKCQSVDWKITGTGQRHKNWCGLYEHGEEDIDWEVAPVPSKGLGLKAKRLIPAGYRIIVEPAYTNPNDHPGIKDLEPRGGSIEEKFKLNAFQGELLRTGEGGRNSANMLSLRIARLNHSCRPNAAKSYDETARVSILLALKDIQPGEEICIAYTYFGGLYLNCPAESRNRENDPVVQSILSTQFGHMVHPDDILLSPEEQEFSSVRGSLRFDWGIICPSDCYCKDPQSKELVIARIKLFKQMHFLASEGRIEDALTAGEKLLKIDRNLNISSWADRAAFNFYVFELSMANSKTERKALKYLQCSFEVGRLLAPYSEDTRLYENILKHPEIYTSVPKEEMMALIVKTFSSRLNRMPKYT